MMLDKYTVKPEWIIDFYSFLDDLTDFLFRESKIKFGEFHREAIKQVLENRYIAVMLPVGHLKTTIFSICYPIWRLLREKNYEICLVSSTIEQSMKNLAFIQQIIQDVPWLRHLVPEDRSYTWNKSQLTTTNRNMCYIKPFSPTARGIHPNEIIYDDILRESDISMDEIKDIFWHIFFPRGQTKNCRHIVIGTPISPDDLFHEIKEKADKGGEWKFFSYPAIIDGKPLWPERFTMSELQRIRESMGEYRFSREYLCSPVSEQANFFPLEMIMNCTDDEYSFTYSTAGRVYIGADFAMSESPSGDFTVYTVVDHVPEAKRNIIYKGKQYTITVKNAVIIRRMERFRSSTGHIDRLHDLVRKYSPEKVIVDISSFGMRFAQELRERGVSVDAQDFRPANRANLLVNLRRLMESDDILNKPPRLIIPTSQKDMTFSVTKHLIKELSGFQEEKTKAGHLTIASSLKHDDTVMSLALAVKDIVDVRPTPKNFIQIVRPQRI